MTPTLQGCKSKGIKLCGALAAAGLIAARASKHLPDHQWEKYAVVTLLDCRSLLDPPLFANDFGKPLNTITMKKARAETFVEVFNKSILKMSTADWKKLTF